ncbi:MAG: addiction module protein [Myxococcota bacterium]
MTPAERWALIERLWASLGHDAFELTPTQKAELDRRLQALDEDVANGRPLERPWDDVKARLFRKPEEGSWCCSARSRKPTSKRPLRSTRRSTQI